MAIEGKEWLYFLIDSMGRTAQVENGIIVFKSNFKPLVYTPDGWQDISIGWERNLSKFGINRNFSLPLGFVLDGKDIVDYVCLNKNFDEKIFLLIQKQFMHYEATKYYYYYDKFYRGELDFTTVQSEENKTTVNLMEGSLSKQLKAYENQSYEFPVDDSESVSIKMDGMILTGSKRFLVIDPIYSHGIDNAVKEMIPMQDSGQSEGFFFNIGFAESVASLTDANYSFIQGEDLSTSDKWNGRVSESVSFSIHMEGSIRKLLFGGIWGPRVGLDVKIETSSGTIFDLFSLNHDFGPTFTDAQPWLFSINSAIITIPSDETFFVYTVPNANQSNNAWQWEDDVIFEYKTIDRFKQTTIKALKPYTLYKRLIGRITGSELNALSALLEAHTNLVVTSGDAIRGISGAVIKTNLIDFFTSFNTILNAGMGIENNKVVFETKEHFFDESNPIHLGKVRNFKWKYATELLVNSVKIGWPNQTYDDVNGRQEFNTTQERSSVVQRISKALELVSVYRADPFGIELTRINLEGKTTTDSSADNDVFIINVDLSSQNGDGSYNLKRETYDSITGLLSPSTVFNIEELTAARLLEKHRSWINSVFYGFEGTKLTYQTSDKNRELKTVKGSTVYDEDADFTITDSPRILKPIIFEFEPETLSNLVELMEANPNRCFSFEHPNGNTYTGYNLKIGIAPNTLEEQAFQLISTASNDLKTLING